MRSYRPSLHQDVIDQTEDEIVKLTMVEASHYAEAHREGSILGEAWRIRSGSFLLATASSMQGNEGSAFKAFGVKTAQLLPKFRFPFAPLVPG